MKSICFLALLLLGFGHLNAQTDTTGIIYQFTEELPVFPGGDKALVKFISTNTHYPKDYNQDEIQHKVLVRFVINKDGSVSDVQVIRSVNPVFDTEAIRVIKMLPKFKPAKQNGKPVRVYFNTPVSFNKN